MNTTSDGLLYNIHCPFDYCALSNKPYDLQDDPDSQCAFHRAGRLCGGCKKKYSLAIATASTAPGRNAHAHLLHPVCARGQINQLGKKLVS